jgi:hypothetical protein
VIYSFLFSGLTFLMPARYNFTVLPVFCQRAYGEKRAFVPFSLAIFGKSGFFIDEGGRGHTTYAPGGGLSGMNYAEK